MFARMKQLSKMGVTFDAENISCLTADLLSLCQQEVDKLEEESMKKSRSRRG